MARFVPRLETYKRQGTFRRTLVRVLSVLVLAWILSITIQSVFISHFEVRSQAMTPSLRSGDLVGISPLLFGKRFLFSDTNWLDFAAPSRGDLVLLDPPHVASRGFPGHWLNMTVELATLGRKHGWDLDPERRDWQEAPVVRRVVALPGDTVMVRNGVILVRPAGAGEFVEAVALSSRIRGKLISALASIEADNGLLYEMPPTEIPKNEFFLLADDPEGYLDSRHWGPVSRERFRGGVIYRYWPFDRFGLVD